MNSVFKSPFAPYIERYISLKVNAGNKASSYDSYLRIFDRFCVKRDIKEPIFTKADCDEWMKQRDCEGLVTQGRRIGTVRQFLIHLAERGFDVVVPVSFVEAESDFCPHIYSDDEKRKYFYEVDTFCSHHNPYAALQYPVMFRLLYCCGTRINETLHIKKKDVDLEEGIIRLEETKNHTERYIVLGNDLHSLFKRYAEKCFYLIRDDDWIFRNSNGGLLQPTEVFRHHKLFLQRAGIPFYGNQKGPRLHDWRHHFAVYSFKQLSDSGMDMYVALPVLSAYLGHKNIYATEKYIRLTQSLFPEITKKIYSTLGGNVDET